MDYDAKMEAIEIAMGIPQDEEISDENERRLEANPKYQALVRKQRALLVRNFYKLSDK